MKTITIDPITRLEGHGKIEIFLNDEGDVENAFLQIPELRGFEKFCEGRPVEEMPRIVPRICGVCPAAHHMAYRCGVSCRPATCRQETEGAILLCSHDSLSYSALLCLSCTGLCSWPYQRSGKKEHSGAGGKGGSGNWR